MKNFTYPKTNSLLEKLNANMQFLGGLPMLILRDHINGRVKVTRKGVWIATVLPRILADGTEFFIGIEDCELISYPDSEVQERNNVGHVAYLLSEFQKANGMWSEDLD